MAHAMELQRRVSRRRIGSVLKAQSLVRELDLLRNLHTVVSNTRTRKECSSGSTLETESEWTVKRAESGLEWVVWSRAGGYRDMGEKGNGKIKWESRGGPARGPSGPWMPHCCVWNLSHCCVWNLSRTEWLWPWEWPNPTSGQRHTSGISEDKDLHPLLAGWLN